MQVKKVIAVIIGILVLFIVVVLIANIHTVKIVCNNLMPEKEELDTSSNWDGGKSYEHVQYSEVSNTDYLHLYVPDSEEPLPLYIMVHGGGFFTGDLESRQSQLFYRYVRDQGYAVATINYRLGNEAAYPAAIEDVKAAVRFLRANAAEYGIDPERFAIAGESAGGYLACMAAVTSDEEFMGVPFVGEEDLDTPVSAQVQAVVDFYGCVQFFTFDEEFDELKISDLVVNVGNYWISDITKETGFNTMEESWIGKNVSEMSVEEKEKYSVTYYAKENCNENQNLKTVILHGDSDITVPCLQSTHFAALIGDLLGEDQVAYRILDGYGHAADGFYSADILDWMIEQIGW